MQRFQGLGQDERRVDRGTREAAAQDRDNLIGHVGRNPHLCLLGRGAQVRRGDDTLVRDQAFKQFVIADRLLAEDIEGRTGDMARFECVQERLFVDQAAARAVDEACAGLHETQLVLADQATCAIGPAGEGCV